MTDTPNVVNMETAARLIREAKEAREKRKRAREAIEAKRKAWNEKALADALATIESDLITVEVFKHVGIDDLEV